VIGRGTIVYGAPMARCICYQVHHVRCYVEGLYVDKRACMRSVDLVSRVCKGGRDRIGLI